MTLVNGEQIIFIQQDKFSIAVLDVNVSKETDTTVFMLVIQCSILPRCSLVINNIIPQFDWILFFTNSLISLLFYIWNKLFSRILIQFNKITSLSLAVSFISIHLPIKNSKSAALIPWFQQLIAIWIKNYILFLSSFSTVDKIYESFDFVRFTKDSFYI